VHLTILKAALALEIRFNAP